MKDNKENLGRFGNYAGNLAERYFSTLASSDPRRLILPAAGLGVQLIGVVNVGIGFINGNFGEAAIGGGLWVSGALIQTIGSNKGRNRIRK